MEIPVKISKRLSFYIAVSRKKPFEKEVIKVEKSDKPTKMSLADMEKNLDIVNTWIGNCDQKASFLLTVVGVVLTIIFTSSLMEKIATVLIDPFRTYLNTGIGTFSLLRTVIAVLLSLGMVCLFVALLFLLLSLKANININQFKKDNPGLETDSLLFYGSISRKTYSEYSLAEHDMYNDYRSQVYINSSICNKKFKKYKAASILTFIATLLLVPAFALLIFV